MSEDKSSPQAVRLVELVNQHAELFHDPENKGYAVINVSNHRETWPIRSKGFREWLSREFYRTEKRVPSTQGMQDALVAIEGEAVFDADEHPIFTRVGFHEGSIYVDLGGKHWDCVEITPDAHWLLPKPDVRFRRFNGMRPIPCPDIHTADLDALWQFLNVSSREDQVLVASWLVGAYRHSGPYPILILQGEQGTGKTVACRVLRSLIDPSVAMVRAMPRSERDLMIAAQNGWVLTFDNISGMRSWLSDALCRLSTGGGFGTRELYSDSDEVLIDVQRPIILNGIDSVGTRQDLLDRSIVINLDPIPDSRRIPET